MALHNVVRGIMKHGLDPKVAYDNATMVQLEKRSHSGVTTSSNVEEKVEAPVVVSAAVVDAVPTVVDESPALEEVIVALSPETVIASVVSESTEVPEEFEPESVVPELKVEVEAPVKKTTPSRQAQVKQVRKTSRK